MNALSHLLNAINILRALTFSEHGMGKTTHPHNQGNATTNITKSVKLPSRKQTISSYFSVVKIWLFQELIYCVPEDKWKNTISLDFPITVVFPTPSMHWDKKVPIFSHVAERNWVFLKVLGNLTIFTLFLKVKG